MKQEHNKQANNSAVPVNATGAKMGYFSTCFVNFYILYLKVKGSKARVRPTFQTRIPS